MSQSFWDSLEHRIPTVVDRTLHAYADASPRYQGTVPEYLYRHMAHSCQEGARLFVRMGRDGYEPRDADLRLFHERGRDRGAEGLPVTDFVESYFYLAETLWEQCCLLARDRPPAHAAGELLRCVRRLLHVAVHAHQQEFEFAHSEEREAAGGMLRALVAGEPVVELAHRAGIRVAAGYAVVALGLGTHPTESIGDTVGQRLGGRRKIGRINEQLTRTLGTDTLSELGPDGGLVLFPAGTEGKAHALSELRLAMPRLQQAADIEVHAGFAHATTVESVPSAVPRAQKLLRLATGSGQVATLDEYLFEYHLCHDSDAVPQLRAMTARLDAEPDLATTLSVYFANDFNRRETARQLHVHPNTIDNRLGRITMLTGANPRTARGLLVLGAALGTVTEPPRSRH